MNSIFGCRESRLLDTYALLENEEDDRCYFVSNVDGKCEPVNSPSAYTHELFNKEFPDPVCSEVADVYPVLDVKIETIENSMFSSSTKVADESVLFASRISSCNHVLIYFHQCNLGNNVGTINMHLAWLLSNKRYKIQVGKCTKRNVHMIIESPTRDVVCLYLSDTDVLSIKLIKQLS